jgi:pimeloyl-ACP methyl ester carboxylesterase
MSGLRGHVLGPSGSRLSVLVGGPPEGTPVCLVHGNLSSARFFEPLTATLPAAWRVVAPDLRGFGHSDPAPVDARRGMGDFADDLERVLEDPRSVKPGRRVHLLGWSMGGGVVMHYATLHPERVASVCLVAPLPPYGFGGTKDAQGTLCHPDGAGSGAGLVAPELVRRLSAGDKDDGSPSSARSLLRYAYVHPPFRLPRAVEDLFVDEILLTALGEANYPGDTRPSEHWPGVAPGVSGVANAMSPLYCDLSGFAEVAASVPVLWVRGDEDKVVSDRSNIDAAVLGRAGVLPGWPGEEVFPPQPMVSQTREMLRRAERMGGKVVEALFSGCGHSPPLEQPERFCRLFVSFVTTVAEQAWARR